MRTYTESGILADVECPEWSEDFGTYGGIKYTLSDGERVWLDFVRGKYSVADYIDKYTEPTGETIFYPDLFSKALDDDCGGFGKAVCLSDDSALQKIFFYGYEESQITI